MYPIVKNSSNQNIDQNSLNKYLSQCPEKNFYVRFLQNVSKCVFDHSVASMGSKEFKPEKQLSFVERVN